MPTMTINEGLPMNRLTEEQNLLERSMKKSRMSTNHAEGSSDDVTMESIDEQGAVVQDDLPAMEVEGTDRVMEDGRRKNGNGQIVIRLEITESYGPWMLAPRRQNRPMNHQKGKNLNSRYENESLDNREAKGKDVIVSKESTKGKNIKKMTGREGSEANSSRFAILGDLQEEDIVLGQENTSMEMHEELVGDDEEHYVAQGGKKLSGKGKRASVQVSEKQILNQKSSGKRDNRASISTNNEELVQSEKQNVRNTSSKPNQAAAESSHIVVRGRAVDKVVRRETVYNGDLGYLETGGIDIDSLEHHGDPPNNLTDYKEKEPGHECITGEGMRGNLVGVPLR
nr:uncharacterized protein LOC109162703 [Ipomoea batatas]